MLLNVSAKKDSSISITPLIDVVFILLLFFMLSSTFQREKQIEMKTSSASSESSSKQDDKSHKLLLDIDEMIYIDGIKYQLNSEEFNANLNNFVKNNEQVILAANPEVKTQKFIEILDSLKTAGVIKLNISKSELP
jgi:biopolymer transport protein ExbD